MNPSFMRCFFARYLPNAMHVDEKNKQRFFGRLMSPSFLVLAIWGSLATGVCGATASDERLPSFEGRIVSLHEVSCGSDLPCQDLTVRITTGELQGKDLAVRMTPGNFVSGFRAIHLKVGDTVLLEGERGDGDVHAVVVDVVRRPALFTLTALFLFCVVIFGGIGAIRSVFGMAVSFVVVFSFILPRIIAGDSPLVISIIGATAGRDSRTLRISSCLTPDFLPTKKYCDLIATPNTVLATDDFISILEVSRPRSVATRPHNERTVIAPLAITKIPNNLIKNYL
jgi:hypothetical protein